MLLHGEVVSVSAIGGDDDSDEKYGATESKRILALVGGVRGQPAEETRARAARFI
jgi:hypothetical protein